MPLLPIKPFVVNENGKKRYPKYTCTLSTIGPVREEWGPEILDWIIAFFHKFGVVWEFKPRLKFETSDTGYPHFHLGERSVNLKTYGGFISQLQKYMRKFKDVKPTGYAHDKDFSIRVFRVPIVETHNSKVLRGKDLIQHYLDSPTKEKSTEGGSWTMEIPGFDPEGFISAFGAEAQARMNKYLSKYRRYAATHDVIPLSSHILGNQPPLHRLEVAYAEAHCRRWGAPFFWM